MSRLVSSPHLMRHWRVKPKEELMLVIIVHHTFYSYVHGKHKPLSGLTVLKKRTFMKILQLTGLIGGCLLFFSLCMMELAEDKIENVVLQLHIPTLPLTNNLSGAV